MEWSDFVYVANLICKQSIKCFWWAVEQADRPVIFWIIFFLMGIVAPFLVGYNMGHTAGWAEGYNTTIGFHYDK